MTYMEFMLINLNFGGSAFLKKKFSGNAGENIIGGTEDDHGYESIINKLLQADREISKADNRIQ